MLSNHSRSFHYVSFDSNLQIQEVRIFWLNQKRPCAQSMESIFDQRNRYVKSVKISNKRTTTILSHYTWPIDRKPLYKVGNEQKTSSGRNFFAVIQYAGTRGLSRSWPFHRSRIIYGRDFLCESPCDNVIRDRSPIHPRASV